MSIIQIHSYERVLTHDRDIRRLVDKNTNFFGSIREMYTSKVAPGEDKGWKISNSGTQYLTCLMGAVTVTWESQQKSGEYLLAAEKPAFLEIPASVRYRIVSKVPKGSLGLLLNLIDFDYLDNPTKKITE